MKLPVRAAPPPPSVNYQSQSSWKDDLFSDDPFATSHERMEKKKPPPRPPPPKFNRAALAKPDVPSRPAHFNRKPTILSNLMSKRQRPATTSPSQTTCGDFQSHVIIPPPKSNQNNGAVASLIDFSSPPSSPTLTTRSSSDGLSVDSFGSDITSSTVNGNTNFNGGNSSQAESGFEDDFDLFSSNKNNDADPWGGFDPFSPPKTGQKTNVVRPVYDSDFLDPLCNGKSVVPKVQTHSIPTIIRPKPARPKAPKNSLLLSSTLQELQISSDKPKPAPRYNVQNIDTSLDMFDSGEYSPPMPTMPPPPPPPEIDDDYLTNDIQVDDYLGGNSLSMNSNDLESEEPYGVALYDFPGTHDDDLPFSVNDKIRLLRRLNDEWMYGRLRSGMEGMFPANFIEIKVPLKENNTDSVAPVAHVTALYDFCAQQEGDLGFVTGDRIKVLAKLNDEWLYGELGLNRGQFPANYVDRIPDGLPSKPS